MNSQHLCLSRLSAAVLLDRLRFLSCSKVMFETFEAASEPHFDAEVWASAATELVQRLEAGRPVDMDRTNTVILVEALEGSGLDSAGWQQLAALLAQRLEPYIGRPVKLDTWAAQN